MGKLSNYKTKRVIGCLTNKLNIAFRSGNEQTGWFEVEGQKILRVTVPKEHGGSSGSSLSKRVARKVINSLRLTNEEFDSLYECPMSGTDFRKKVDNLIKSGKL